MTPDEVMKMIAAQNAEIKKDFAEATALLPGPAVDKAIASADKVKAAAKTEVD